MAGLVPAIHALPSGTKNVDARDKPGHDDLLHIRLQRPAREVTRSLAPSEPRDAAVQVVLVGALDLRGDDLADAQRAAAGEIDRAVNLRRVGLGAAF